MRRRVPRDNWTLLATLATAVACLWACTASSPPTVVAIHAARPAEPPVEARSWVGTWTSAQQLTEPRNMPPEPGLVGATLRQVIQPTLGGSKLRVTLSNQYGDTPLSITGARVARSAGGGAIQPTTDTPLAFDGRETVTIAPGAFATSDSVGFASTPFGNLAVTLTFGGQVPSSLTGHPGSRTTSYVEHGSIDTTDDMTNATRVDHWYVLAGVDVWAPASSKAVVIVGDSITDGHGSTPNENDRWPNVLARRLSERPATAHVAVLNQGIGGNRVLRDGLGPSLASRIDRDVLGPPGVRWLIVLAGINDLGTATDARKSGEPHASAGDLIAAFEEIVGRARSKGIVVYGATILPFEGSFYFSTESERERQRVNEWIRTSGRFDAVIDFDAITRDPNAPSRLSSVVDGGDHLHPSAAGYRIMADAIDPALFGP